MTLRVAPQEGAKVGGWLSKYLRVSELPLHSLFFLLPALVVFEVGTAFHPSDPIAFRMLQSFFHQLGANGRYIPALALVGILLTWHIARKDPWRVNVETLWGMLFESWALALPLLALGISVARWRIHAPLFATVQSWRDDAILSLGAGVYEEVVFRLILMTAITLLLGDILRLPKNWTGALMVGISAVLFSLYHYLGSEPFELKSFAFRTVAGIYFAILFLTRGFGVTAGSHIAYDILVVSLQAMSAHQV
jgi:hypothetical protein